MAETAKAVTAALAVTGLFYWLVLALAKTNQLSYNRRVL
jgi:hypothetical protein